jgi:hypothetical protein
MPALAGLLMTIPKSYAAGLEMNRSGGACISPGH